MKRRVRRDRKKVSTPCSSSNPEITPKRGEEGHTGKKNRPSFVDTSSSMQKVVKKTRTQSSEPYVTASFGDSLARTIVLEGYPEWMVNPELLTFLQRAVVNELAGIHEGVLSRFTGTAVLRNSAMIIHAEDEMALSWLSGRIGLGISLLGKLSSSRRWTYC